MVTPPRSAAVRGPASALATPAAAPDAAVRGVTRLTDLGQPLAVHEATFRHMLWSQLQNQPPPDYLATGLSPEITPAIRSIVADWMLEVRRRGGCMHTNAPIFTFFSHLFFFFFLRASGDGALCCRP